MKPWERYSGQTTAVAAPSGGKPWERFRRGTPLAHGRPAFSPNATAPGGVNTDPLTGQPVMREPDLALQSQPMMDATLGDSFQQGVYGLQRGFHTQGATLSAGKQTAVDDIEAMLQAGDQQGALRLATTMPEWGGAQLLESPELRARAREGLGSFVESRGAAADKAADAAARLPQSRALVGMMSDYDATGLSGAVQGFMRDPVGVLGHVTAQSAPALGAALAGTVLGGPIGAGAAAGATEYMYSLPEGYGHQPPGTTTAQMVQSPEARQEASDFARKRGTAIGAASGVGTGIAGMRLAPRRFGPVAGETTNLAAQTGVQMGAGAAGEAAAQELTVGADNINWAEVLLEGLAETVSAPGAVLAMRGNIASARRAAAAFKGKPPEQITVGDLEDTAQAGDETAQAVLNELDAAALRANGIDPANPGERAAEAEVLLDRLRERRAAEAARTQPDLPQTRDVRQARAQTDQVRDETQATADIETGEATNPDGSPVDPAFSPRAGAQPRRPVPETMAVTPEGQGDTGDPGIRSALDRNRGRPTTETALVPTEPSVRPLSDEQVAQARRRMEAQPVQAPGEDMVAPDGQAPRTRAEMDRDIGELRERIGEDPVALVREHIGVPEQDFLRMSPEGRERVVAAAQRQRTAERPGPAMATTDAAQSGGEGQYSPSSAPQRGAGEAGRGQQPTGTETEASGRPYARTAAGTGDRPFRPDFEDGRTAEQQDDIRSRMDERTARARAQSEEELRQRWQEREEARSRQRQQGSASEQAREGDTQTSNRPKDPDGDGRFGVDDRGYVASTKGGPIRFADQKQAARWILNVGQKTSPDQVFDIANHPSGAGFTVRETGRTDPGPEGSTRAEPEAEAQAQARAAPADTAPQPERPQGPPRRLSGPQRAEPVAEPEPAAPPKPKPKPAAPSRESSTSQWKDPVNPGRRLGPKVSDAAIDKKVREQHEKPLTRDQKREAEKAKQRSLESFDAALEQANSDEAVAYREALEKWRDKARRAAEKKYSNPAMRTTEARRDDFYRGATNPEYNPPTTGATAAKEGRAWRRDNPPPEGKPISAFIETVGGQRTEFTLNPDPEKIQKVREQVANRPPNRFYSNPFDPDLIRWAIRPAVDAVRENRTAQAVPHLVRFVFGFAGSDVRAMAKQYDSPTLARVVDMFTDDPGSGRATGTVFHESVMQVTNDRLVKLRNILGDMALRPEKHRGDLEFLRDLMTSGRGRSNQGRMQEKAKALRALLDEHWKYLRDSGLDVGQRTNYFPRVLDIRQVASRPDAARDAITKLYRNQGKDQQDAEASANDLVNTLIQGSSMPPGNPGKSGAPSAMKERVFGPEADTVLREFLITDPIETLTQYFQNTTRRAELASRFGAKFEKWGEMLNAITEEGAVDAIAALRSFVTAAAGLRPGAAFHDNHAARVASQWARAWTALMYLERATLSSLAEFATPAIRTGNLADVGRAFGTVWTDLWRGVGSGRRTLDAKERRKRVEDLQILASGLGESINAARFAGTDPQSKALSKQMERYFRRIGLEQWTEGTIVAASTVGESFVRRLARDVARGEMKGRAVRDLADFGVPRNKVDAFGKWVSDWDGNLETGDPEMVALYRTAITRFVGQATMRPNATTKPRWASHPFGALVFQLMSFSYAFTKNVLMPTGRRAAAAVTDRDLTLRERAAMASGLAMLPVLAIVQAAVGGLRDWAFEDPERLEEMTDQDAAFRAISRAGLFGILDPAANLGYRLTSGEGRYGASTLSIAGGPFLNAIGKTGDAALGLAEGANSPNTNTAERRAAKEFYNFFVEPSANLLLGAVQGSGVPGMLLAGAATQTVGSKRTRDAFADALAGPPTADRSGSRGLTGGGGLSGGGGLTGGGGLSGGGGLRN